MPTLLERHSVTSAPMIKARRHGSLKLFVLRVIETVMIIATESMYIKAKSSFFGHTNWPAATSNLGQPVEVGMYGFKAP